MNLSELDEYKAATGSDRSAAQTAYHGLHRRSWRNWLLLAVVSVITVTGLATAIPPLLSNRVITLWPWVNTELILLVGLSVTILFFVMYLTQQQRSVLAMQSALQELQDRSNDRTRRHYMRLFALLNVSRIIGSETDLDGVFDCITSICVETFSGNRSSLMLYDKEAENLFVRSASGADSEKIIGRRQNLGEGIAGWAAKNRQALFLSRYVDLTKYPGLDVEDTTALAAMVVPIIVRDELVGVLNVSTKNADVVYDDEDLRALQVFAENAGSCIRHTELIEWMRKTIERLQCANRERILTCGRKPIESDAERS
ncbi:MAG TPA: GAF domain-containing protein [Patescibacteria group bacterium]|nr:GAF domain-containing protein [Patescibacteria group bacterium]